MIPDILAAMRADSIRAERLGRWSIRKTNISAEQAARSRIVEAEGKGKRVPAGQYTFLYCKTEPDGIRGEVVMNDFASELKKHLEFILVARGRVLVTGLGLGCVVRGLLKHGRADEIHIVEREADVIGLCGKSVADSRVVIHHADALKWIPDRRFDFAWHDLWSDPLRKEQHLQRLHSRLIVRLVKRDLAEYQGAWAMPRWFFRGRKWSCLGIVGVKEKKRRRTRAPQT